MRFSPITLLFTLLALLALFAPALAAGDKQDPLVAGKEAVKRYIISFETSATAATIDNIIEKVKNVGGQVINRFSIIPAMTVEVPASFVNSFAAIPGIESVEEDQPVHALGGF